MPHKGYVIAQVIEIHDQDGFDRYRELVGPAVAKYDGQFLVRGLEKVKSVATWFAIAHNMARSFALQPQPTVIGC